MEPADMDMHRPLPRHGTDPRPGKTCEFCKTFDPQFSKRYPLDQLVLVKGNDVASAHLTEGGHVAHKLAELCMRARSLSIRQLRQRERVHPAA